jgi:glycosyltransferase involved in cell wall biosynthesis
MSAGFSVLLPVYAGDEAAHLARALESIAEQTLPPAELVVVEDGPLSEGSHEVLDEFAAGSAFPVVRVRLTENVGLAEALNRGLAACSFEVVARMDADDVSVPERFARQVPLVEGGLDLLGSGLYEWELTAEGREVVLGKRVPPLDAEGIRRAMPFRDPFNHPTVVYRRSAVLQVGGYDSVGTMEDYLLFARMLAAGARVANLPELLVGYRVSSGAYHRRGGWRLLRTELRLQREFRAAGITTRAQCVRNIIVRGGYRIVPVWARRPLYRRVFTSAVD